MQFSKIMSLSYGHTGTALKSRSVSEDILKLKISCQLGAATIKSFGEKDQWPEARTIGKSRVCV